MRLKSCIRWVEVITVGLIGCLLVSIDIHCGYMIFLSICATGISMYVRNDMIEIRKAESRKVCDAVKRLVVIEQSRQDARDELFDHIP